MGTKIQGKPRASIHVQELKTDAMTVLGAPIKAVLIYNPSVHGGGPFDYGGAELEYSGKRGSIPRAVRRAMEPSNREEAVVALTAGAYDQLRRGGLLGDDEAKRAVVQRAVKESDGLVRASSDALLDAFRDDD